MFYMFRTADELRNTALQFVEVTDMEHKVSFYDQHAISSKCKLDNDVSACFV